MDLPDALSSSKVTRLLWLLVCMAPDDALVVAVLTLTSVD